MKFQLILILITLSLNSCGRREKITAFVRPESLSNSVFELQIPIDKMDVPHVTGDVEGVPVIGDIFSDLASSLADMSLIEENGREIEVEPQVFEFPDIDKSSFSQIKALFLKNVEIRAFGENREGLSLHFIRKIQVYLDASSKISGSEELSEEEKQREGRLILSFDRSQDSFCDFTKCLKMKSQYIDWKSTLENNKRFIIRASILVDSVPKEKMEITGDLSVQTIIDPGF